VIEYCALSESHPATRGWGAVGAVGYVGCQVPSVA
jgi:hypothetical protein